MNYKVLVLDIDGTVTNSKKEISPRTLRSLFQIQEKGIKVVLASGRPTPGISSLAKQLHLEKFGGYILSYNGAKIIDCKTNNIIYQSVIPKPYLPKLYEAAKEFGVGIMSYENDTVIAGTPIDCYMEQEAKINGIPIREIQNFPEYITFDVNKCIMTEDGSYLESVEPKLQERFQELSIYRSEPYFLEIMPQNVDKAKSLEKLLEHLHFSREEMICCGDGFNDVSMIQFAGLGVAMENAQQKVKEVADFITHSNDQDGIVHVIDTFLLGSTVSV